MKLKVIDRIMLALYAILGILALTILGACVLWPEIYALNFYGIMMNVCGTQTGKIVGCALIVVLISGLIHLIAAASCKEVRGPKNSVSVQNTESGAVRVSVQAMDSLVRRAIGNQEGVLDVKSRIVNHDDSITVHIDMALAMDSHIPNITMIMQRRIKRYIEETSGIAVREVIVLVSEIRDDLPPAIPAPVEAEQETVAAEEAAVEEPAAEEAVPEEAVFEEAVCDEAEAGEEMDEISETDELIALEEAAEMEEAAVLEDVLAMEPDGEAEGENEAEKAEDEVVEITADDVK